MSKQKQRELTPAEERQQRVEQKMQDLDKEYLRLEKEQKLKDSKVAFGKRKQELAERVADMIESHGKDYFMSQTMMMFLDVAIQMEDLLTMLTDVNLAMSCVTDAMVFMDDILETNDLQLDSTLNVKHGFWQRLKAKRKIRKTIRNNNGRMKEMTLRMTSSQKIAINITNALMKSSGEMRTAMERNAARQKKFVAKRSDDGSATGDSAAARLVSDILVKRGGASKVDGGSPSFGSGGPVGGGASSSTDDISDIL